MMYNIICMLFMVMDKYCIPVNSDALFRPFLILHSHDLSTTTNSYRINGSHRWHFVASPISGRMWIIDECKVSEIHWSHNKHNNLFWRYKGPVQPQLTNLISWTLLVRDCHLEVSVPPHTATLAYKFPSSATGCPTFSPKAMIPQLSYFNVGVMTQTVITPTLSSIRWRAHKGHSTTTTKLWYPVQFDPNPA